MAILPLLDKKSSGGRPGLLAGRRWLRCPLPLDGRSLLRSPGRRLSQASRRGIGAVSDWSRDAILDDPVGNRASF